MDRDIADIADALGSLATVTEPGDVTELVELIEAYFRHPDAGAHIELWFHFLERFPDADGLGAFWSILHAIERYPGSDELAVASVKRRPSRFPVTMVNRMMNASICRVVGTDLLGLLENVAASDCALSVREDAAHFAAYQRRKA